ncbi:dihydrodipicolinate synthase family protein [Bacillus licheniformis]|nr:dihydrodipicolinate synthase family protein [Bacillus licheniformis]
MADLGADVLSIITPYFVAPSQEELYQHFRTISEMSRFLSCSTTFRREQAYHWSPKQLKGWRHCRTSSALRTAAEASPILRRILSVQRTVLSVLAGTDSLILDTLKAGGTGAVAATANVFPHTVVSIYESFKQGNIEESEHYQQQLQPLRDTFHSVHCRRR